MGGDIVLTSSSVNVPANFAGMQNLTTAQPDGFTSNVARNWDQKNGTVTNAVVSRITSSAGVYNWVSFDAFFTANAGKKIIFTLGYPADWMITRSAIGGAHEGGKANMCPTGATEIANYVLAVTDIVNRAKNTFGATGVVWELWNEIEGTGFYADVQSALGPYAKAVYQAIKAVDSTAIVLSANVSGSSSNALALVSGFLQASDGATGKGGDWCDAFSCHFYEASQPWYFSNYIDKYRAQLAIGGYPSLPLWMTETGMLSPEENEAKTMQQRMVIAAAKGLQSFVGYATDYIQNPLQDIASAWNATVAAISGKTITGCTKNADGTVTAIVNGSAYTV